jgi:hypothetical protein
LSRSKNIPDISPLVLIVDDDPTVLLMERGSLEREVLDR